MTELFRTNVDREESARDICKEIANFFPAYAVNFDLEDCDRIMRVKSMDDIDARAIMVIVARCGFDAQILPDEIPGLAASNQWQEATR